MRPMVIANWKMYLGLSETLRAARAARALLARAAGRTVDVVVCPSFPSLVPVRALFQGSRLAVGAQDLHAEPAGPYTGEVSALQLQGVARYVILGHSERRRFSGETDALVAQKVRRALRAGLKPIICVGETAEEREAGETVQKVRSQVDTILQGVPALSLARCTFAYEPIWAISAGINRPGPQPVPADAGHLLGLMRKVAAEKLGRRPAAVLRVVYGGSVTARSVGAFVREPGVDGVLVGAASTKPGEFAAIVRQVVASSHQRDHHSARGRSGPAVRDVRLGVSPTADR